MDMRQMRRSMAAEIGTETRLFQLKRMQAEDRDQEDSAGAFPSSSFSSFSSSSSSPSSSSSDHPPSSSYELGDPVTKVTGLSSQSHTSSHPSGATGEAQGAAAASRGGASRHSGAMSGVPQGLGMGGVGWRMPTSSPRTAPHPALSRARRIAALVRQIRRHADPEIVHRCVAMVQGRPGFLGHSFSQAGQDWILFQNYFSHIPYGRGTYIDIGSNHPFIMSNTYFFDRCLGWKGLCIEPNREYHPLYKEHKRSCKLVSSCVSATGGRRGLDFSQGTQGTLLPEGQGEEVECRTLSEILIDNGMRGANFATIDIEGSEFDTLRCFPFRAHGISTWLVETNKAKPNLYNLFLRSGFAHVADILQNEDSTLVSNRTRVGWRLDSLFRRITPSFIFGPDFLPGHSLEGQGPRPACRPGTEPGTPQCPEQMAVIGTDELTWDFKIPSGTCGQAKGMESLQPGTPDTVLPTMEHPFIGRSGL